MAHYIVCFTCILILLVVSKSVLDLVGFDSVTHERREEDVIIYIADTKRT